MEKTLFRFFGLVLTLALIHTSAAEEMPTKMTPLQLSVWDPVQLVPSDRNVYGFRLNLPYGKNKDVYGIDVGFVNQVSRNFGGIQVGLLNSLRDGVGLQIGAFNCIGEADSQNGLQVGFFNVAEFQGGFQIGFYNKVGCDCAGIQFGGDNIVGHDLVGMQVGVCGRVKDQMTGAQLNGPLWGGNHAYLVKGCQISLDLFPFTVNPQTNLTWFCNNKAKDLNGVQIALWCNKATTAKGLQIGLVNITDTMTGAQIGLVNIIKESTMPFCPIINVCF